MHGAEALCGLPNLPDDGVAAGGAATTGANRSDRLDNGSTRAPQQLAAWIAAQQWPITVQLLWLPVNASWLDQLEIWFSVLQRKILTPNHFVSTDDLEQAIAAFIADHNAHARHITWTYTVEK